MNLNKRYNGRGYATVMKKIRTHFFKLAYSSTEKEYNYNLKLLRDEGGVDIINSFISETPVEHWCRAFFKGCRYGIMANSMAEIFNNWISAERSMAVYCLLNETRIKQMELINNVRSDAERCTTKLAAKIESKLELEMDKSRRFSVFCSSPGVFEVRSEYVYEVNLVDRTCSCMKWQINCFPCPHALAAIQKYPGGDVYDFIDPYFHNDTLKKSCSFPIRPISNVDEGTSEVTSDYMLAPVVKVPLGRRRTKRFKSSGDHIKNPITCRRCGNKGDQNKRTCKAKLNYRTM